MGHSTLPNYEMEPDVDETPSGTGSHLNLCQKPVQLYRPLDSQSVLGSFFSNVKEALFPPKLPPLELTSRPVDVADPMQVKRSPASRVASTVIHVGVIAFILWGTVQMSKHHVVPVLADNPHQLTPIYMPPVAPPAPTIAKGGGGAPQVVKHQQVKLPHYQKLNLNARQIVQNQHPPRHTAPPPSVQLAQNTPDNNLPALGNPSSPAVTLQAQASGTGAGAGQGIGGGIGAGSGGGFGGGVMSVGGGVSAPRLIHSVQPDFTNRARQAKLQGTVGIQLIVDRNGNPEDIHVIQHLGMGLDQKAVEAVRQYKFKPAMFHGHPVPVRLVVQVHFRLY